MKKFLATIAAAACLMIPAQIQAADYPSAEEVKAKLANETFQLTLDKESRYLTAKTLLRNMLSRLVWL